MSKLVDNACRWQKKLNFIFFHFPIFGYCLLALAPAWEENHQPLSSVQILFHCPHTPGISLTRTTHNLPFIADIFFSWDQPDCGGLKKTGVNKAITCLNCCEWGQWGLGRKVKLLVLQPIPGQMAHSRALAESTFPLVSQQRNTHGRCFSQTLGERSRSHKFNSCRGIQLLFSFAVSVFFFTNFGCRFECRTPAKLTTENKFSAARFLQDVWLFSLWNSLVAQVYSQLATQRNCCDHCL